MTTRLGGVTDYEGHPFLLQALTHQLRHLPSPTFSFQPWNLLPTHPHPPPPGSSSLSVEGFGGGEQEADFSSAPYP